MSNYLLNRNNNLSYRRRIPKQFTKYFPKTNEIRITFGKISQIQGKMNSDKINKLFEELIMALQLDTFNNKQGIVLNYLTEMQNYSKTISIVLDDESIYHDDLNERLQKKLEDLDTSKKEKLLQNMDAFENLIHIVDPKKDLTNTPTPIKKANVTLKELYELFIKEKKQEIDEDIAESTWRDYSSSYNDFLYVIDNAENRDIFTFTREDFRTFVYALHNHIPKNRVKLKKFRNLPYSKLKDMVLIDDEKLATDTKKKKISTIKQMFDIAINEQYAYIEKNYAEAFLIKAPKQNKKTKKEPPRTPLSNDSLEKLFKSKYYTTKLEYTLQCEPEEYWIPLIALYSALRQNEICQLYVNDIKSEVVDTGMSPIN